MNLKDIIKDNNVEFSYLKKGMAYYTVKYDGKDYIFPVDLEDLGDGTLYKNDRAIYFMRYIREALDSGTFVITS